MPSKPQMVLLILLIVGGVFGLSRVDWTRDVPYYPPQIAAVIGGGPMPGVPGGGPGGPGDPGGAGVPEPDPEIEDEIRITDLTLARVNSGATEAVLDTGAANFVVLRVGKEGELRWSGIQAGSYDSVGDLMERNAGGEGLSLIVVPDTTTPWQYVYWLMELAAEKGIYELGIGVTPGTDPDGTLLAAMPVELPSGDAALPAGMDKLVIALEDAADDKVKYTVFDEEAASSQKLYEKIASYNLDYREMYEDGYSAKPTSTPWELEAPAMMHTGKVLKALEAARIAGVGAVRFGGEFPPRPGR